MKNFERRLIRRYFDRKVLHVREIFSIYDSISMAKLTAMELFDVLSPEFKEVEAELDLARDRFEDAEEIMQATFKRISQKFKEQDQ
jgi:hypothetical protein